MLYLRKPAIKRVGFVTLASVKFARDEEAVQHRRLEEEPEVELDAELVPVERLEEEREP